MTTDGNPKLNALELMTGAVQHLWSLRNAHAMLAFVVMLPYALMGVLGFLDPFYVMARTGEPVDGATGSILLLILWGVFWNTPALVLWYRLFLVGSDDIIAVPAPVFMERALRLIGYSIMFGLLVLGIAVIAIMVLSLVMSATGRPPEAGVGQGPMAMALIVIALALGGRLCLTFASITLGPTQPFRQAWERTRGNGFAIAAALLLCVFLGGVASALVHALATALLIGPIEGSIPSRLFLIDLVLAPISYASTALVCAVTAGVFWRLNGQPGTVVNLDA
ncbi:MAG: hypothetical protein WEB93_08080 [Sphingomonadales bacterium]